MPLRHLPRALAGLLAIPLLLAGCDDPAPTPPPPAPPTPRAEAPRPPAPAPAQPVAPDGPVVRMAPDFERLAAQVMPAVVSIAITRDARPALPPELRGTPYERFFRDRFRGRMQPEVQGAGSGFIIHPDGLVVTNNHVVGQANRVVVSLLDGTELPARILGTDELTDLAVLRIEAGRPLPYVAFGASSALNIGQWVMAAGNPFGLGGSVTKGIVSALGRNIGVSIFDDFIQTDAPINPGNSGGPLFALSGEVIGINTAIYSPTGAYAGIGFAVPSDLAAPIVEQLAAGRQVRRGWLGVSLGGVAAQQEGRRGVLSGLLGGEGMEPEQGVVVAGVVPRGPADRAGIREGDVIVAVDGERVQGTRELVRRVAGKAPGERASITILRDGRRQDVTVQIGERPANGG
jgi:serine protease Do